MIKFNPYVCPTCGNPNTTQRRGVHFEHERLCYKCGEYDPQEEWEKFQNSPQGKANKLEQLAYQAAFART